MNTPTRPLAVGDRFERDDARPYTVDGVKHVHSQTTLCEVTATDAVGFEYRVVEVSAESDRPDFASTPTGGSFAWFAVPLRIAKGELRIGG